MAPSSASSRTDPAPSGPGGRTQAVLAGVIAGLVGFTSSFAVVLTGLSAVGASPAQGASALLVLSLTMGLGCIGFSLRTRMPVTMAWSTPGAALLAGAALPTGGYAAAVGAFLVAAALHLATGLVRPLGRWVARIPPALASAMLAGVLLSLCVQPFLALADSPAAIAPVVVTWLVLLRLAPRWAVPGAFVAALVVIVATGSLVGVRLDALAPTLTWTNPSFEPLTMLALGLPLYLVTMTSQNIPGVAVMASLGYRAPLSPALVYAGGAGLVTAGLGGFSINLAAISAALSAGPDAGPDPARRWVAGVSTGATYVLLGLASGVVTAVAGAAPAGVIAAVAGLALIATFAASTTAALSPEPTRQAAAVTFLVAASGLSIVGIGAAFWALVAGGVVLLVTRGLRPA